MPIMSRRARPWIENVKPAVLGARPDEPFGIDQQRPHAIAGERLRLLSVVPELLERLGSPVPARHAAAFGREPQIALCVFGDGPEVVAGEPVLVAALAA